MDKNNLYADETSQRWGNTEAYKQSTERVKNMSKEKMIKIQKESDDLMKEIAANMAKGPNSPEIQKLIERHYANLRHFYEPSLEMYRGLGQMYCDDPRFSTHYEKYAPNLAKFLNEAIAAFCDSQSGR